MSGISNIEFLKKFKYLMSLEMPGNLITDVSILNQMRYLTEIDLSNNKLGDALKIDPPPFNLRFMDLSRNQISNCDDLAGHKFLENLSLDSSCS